MIKRIFLLILFLPISVLAIDGTHVPTVDELIQVKSVGSVRISPDGNYVAYTVRGADFEENAYITHIWLANVSTGETFQLTSGKKSASNPKWSPDSQWLAFTSSRSKDKNQIFVIRPNGGEAIRLTDSESGVSNYEWSPDGSEIAFTATEPESKYTKGRKDHMGGFSVVRKEYRFSHLWTFDIDSSLNDPVKGRQKTDGKDFTVGGFSWSPDGNKIAFHAAENPDRINFHTADLFLLDLEADTSYKIVSDPGPDWNPKWSPDGSQILYYTYSGRELYYGYNRNFAIIPANGGEPKIITSDFDENPGFVAWNKNGIYFSALQKTASHLFVLDPKSNKIKRVSKPDGLMARAFSFTKNGKQIAFSADSPSSMREVFVTSSNKFSPRKLTNMTAQTAQFILGINEVISWQSKDGATIEGVLTKPHDFNPNKKYPLLCMIHGGPTGIDRPGLLSRGTSYYPIDIWAARGALVLRVNYRGSAGYGEEFRLLNKRNLGVGDAWDVISGVDYLIEKGWVDSDKVASMGWSQGGYISAFLTTSSDRFAAISVGAGISNWATYYYNTDITPFTVNYLGDDPVDDPEVYQKTSPMSYIKQAKTPTLIQHGENDRRVPIPNAYELRQGLVDRGVPVEMVVYTGFGHGINKPKSQRAVMWHNLAWFNHYLWGDNLPELSKPELPEKEKKE